MGDSEPTAAMAEHRVKFMQFARPRLQRVDADARRRRDLGEILFAGRQKFVQGRVEQANRDRQARHHPKDRAEVAALLGKQPGERGAAARSEEHTSELQSLMRNSYAVFCMKKKTE